MWVCVFHQSTCSMHKIVEQAWRKRPGGNLKVYQLTLILWDLTEASVPLSPPAPPPGFSRAACKWGQEMKSEGDPERLVRITSCPHTKSKSFLGWPPLNTLSTFWKQAGSWPRHELLLGWEGWGGPHHFAPQALSGWRVPLGYDAVMLGILFMTVFSLLPALKFYSPHVNLLIKKFPGALPQLRACHQLWPLLFSHLLRIVRAGNCLSWVSENAQQAEEKVSACNILNFSGSVWHPLPHLFLPSLP